MDFSAEEQLPPLRARRSDTVDEQADRVRRALWQAFQRGELSESQLAQTLDRLEPARAPAAGQEMAAPFAQSYVPTDRDQNA